MPTQESPSVSERRGAARFVFQESIPARLFGIDGAWCRECRILDISDLGARIRIEWSLQGLQMQEFFLVLSTRGTAHRRCELAWFRGEEIGVKFAVSSRAGGSRSRRGQ